MPTTLAPRSGLAAGDPRLAKLKEASLTRRRTLSKEDTIPAFREDMDTHENEYPAQHEVVEPSSTTNAAIAPPSFQQGVTTGDALRILNIDSTSATELGTVNEASRVHRLQAIRSLATLKETGNAPSTALDHLRRRIRSTTVQLAFHEANASSQNAQVLRKSGENNAPWLPSSTISGSKHKAAQLHTNKKKTTIQHQHKENVRPSRPSPQASALQCKLLSELKDRLQLKGVLSAFRQAVQHRHLLESLVVRAVAVETQATLKKVLTSWKEATVPSKEMICAAEFCDYERQVYMAKKALQIWKAWSAARCQRKDAARVGAERYHHRLLAASLAHWKFATNIKHLSLLRSAVVEGWVDTWGRRKALLAWRRTARRQQQQRNGLLAAATAAAISSCGDAPVEVDVTEDNIEDHVVPGGQLSSTKTSTLAEAAAYQRALARSQLTGLKLCVTEVAAELKLMRPGLRWTSFDDKDSSNAQSISLRPHYDPSAYSSPKKGRRQQDGSTSDADCPALAAAKEIAAELFNCNEELAQVENECHALRETLRKLEEEEAALVDIEATEYLHAAQQAEQDVAVAMMAFNDAENELHEAQVVIEIVNEEIELQKSLLEKCLHEARTSRAAADAAAAALASARDEFDTSSTAVEAWTRKVTLAAAELSRVAPTAKSAAALKLKEARHRLEMEKMAAIEARQEIPRLLQRSEETAKAAQESEAALMAARQSALAAGAADTSACSALVSAQAAFCAAETALKEAQCMESSALSAYNCTVGKAAALREDARQVRLQLFTGEREVILLQARVIELDEQHGQYVALSLEYNKDQGDDVLLLESPVVALLEENQSLLGSSDPPGVDGDDLSRIADETRHREALKLDDSENDTLAWSVATTPFSSPSKDLLSITAASRSFYQSRLLHRALHALQAEAVQWKKLKTAADYGYCLSILPAAFKAWKEAASDAVAIDGANIEIVRVLSSLKAWRSYTAKSQLLRQLETEYTEMRDRQKKATCFGLLRLNVATQQRHRDALAISVLSRRSCLFNAWRTWAAQQRQLSETLHVALERKRLRCLSSFMREWRTNSHNDALLRRVFTAALDSWRDSLGAAGYEAQYSLMQRCFAAWQVASHVQREERRDGVLSLAAESTHERSLLSTAFTALRKEVQWVIEKESYLPLAHAALLSWRETSLTSRSHVASLAAQQHYENSLKEKVVNVWSSRATTIACRVSVFYLKWQVDHRRRLVLAAWRKVISDRRKWELRRAEAEALRSKHTSPVGGTHSLHEVVVDTVTDRYQHRPQHRPLHRPADGSLYWSTPSGNVSAGTTPSTGARSITPVVCGSGESWHAKAAEWRQRRELYSGRGGAVLGN